MHNLKLTAVAASFLIITSCGGGGGGGGGSSSSGLPLPTISLSASSYDVVNGSSININWSSTNATSCNAGGAWDGTKDISGSETFTLSLAGTNAFSLTCSGGGGSKTESISVFVFDLGLKNLTININEDSNYSGNVTANPNQTQTTALTYTLDQTTSNGVLTFSSIGNITYTPTENYYGTDAFTYTVYSADRNISKSKTVNINIESVNDLPVLTMDNYADLNTNNLIFDSIKNLNFSYSDVDHALADLDFIVTIDDQNVPATFNEISDGYGALSINLSSLPKGGLYSATITLSDGIDSDSERFTTWFIADKKIITIEQDDDPDDGFGANGGTSTPVQYYVYYLSGNESSTEGTNYLFVGDSLGSETDVSNFRESLLGSINLLNDSDASEFFKGYFKIIVSEPVNPDGTSSASIRTGCYEWDPNIYCIGSGDINDSVFDVMYPDNDLVSVLTTISGRGVNLGNTNIQYIRPSNPTDTRETLMHELGHAHGYMGDEYLTSDDRDVSAYADDNVNTTTQTDPTMLKWKHWITNPENVPGVDYNVCFDYSDGSTYEDLPLSQCNCLWNKFDTTFTTEFDPNCHKKVGLFEGNYYGEFDNYRPKYWTIMEGGILEYGEVNVEGFAVGSLDNQIGYTSSVNSNSVTFTLTNFDSNKMSVRWYEDGIVRGDLTNQAQVTFNKPTTTNTISTYTWKVSDTSGYILAEDDPLDDNDFYEGLFNLYTDWYWPANGTDFNEGFYRNPSDSFIRSNDLNIGYYFIPLGLRYKLNWSHYSDVLPSRESKSKTIQKNIKYVNLSFSGNLDNLEIKTGNSIEGRILNQSAQQLSKSSNLNTTNTITKPEKYSLILNLYSAENILLKSYFVPNEFYANAAHIGYEDERVFSGPVNTSFSIVIDIDNITHGRLETNDGVLVKEFTIK